MAVDIIARAMAANAGQGGSTVKFWFRNTGESWGADFAYKDIVDHKEEPFKLLGLVGTCDDRNSVATSARTYYDANGDTVFRFGFVSVNTNENGEVSLEAFCLDFFKDETVSYNLILALPIVGNELNIAYDEDAAN